MHCIGPVSGGFSAGVTTASLAARIVQATARLPREAGRSADERATDRHVVGPLGITGERVRRIAGVEALHVVAENAELHVAARNESAPPASPSREVHPLPVGVACRLVLHHHARDRVGPPVLDVDGDGGVLGLLRSRSVREVAGRLRGRLEARFLGRGVPRRAYVRGVIRRGELDALVDPQRLGEELRGLPAVATTNLHHALVA